MASEKQIATVFRIMDSVLLGLFNMVRYVARILPPSVLLALADYVGYALFFLRRRARECLLEDLREALPEISDEGELKRIAMKACGATLRVILDPIFMEVHGDRILENLVLDEGVLETLDADMAAGKGLIIFSPHLGGIGIVHCLAARLGRAFTPVVAPPSKTPIPRYLTALADLGSSLGCDPENPVFWTGGHTVSRVQEHLRQGKAVAITYDLPGGTVMDFFGRPTAIASGIAQFACDSGAPIICGYLKRCEKPLHYHLVFYGHMDYQLTGDRSADVHSILEEVIRHGEKMIREIPDQWIGWFGLRGWRRRAEKILQEETKADIDMLEQASRSDLRDSSMEEL